MTLFVNDDDGAPQDSSVVSNQALCREHLKLTVRASRYHNAVAGQFVHICPPEVAGTPYRDFEWKDDDPSRHGGWFRALSAPMLRRAFSIAGLRRVGHDAEIDVIYRVVGTATRWMESLRAGDSVSVLGPLGNAFPIHSQKRHAWLVSGGVGLPPMLWLAEALSQASKSTIAFCGARSRDLLPLTLSQGTLPSSAASSAERCVEEFARVGVKAVISTDDGSLGYHGHIGAAMRAYHEANAVATDDVVVYTCGPERMMRFVAEYCLGRGMECHVCVERNMACGTGLCQSCVVPIRDESAIDGWRYRLCCTDGPVFSAESILWELPAR